MPDIQDVLNQYIDRAKLLLNEGKVKEAYGLCMKVIETDPEHAGALDLRETIQNSIQNYNIHNIDAQLEKLKPLWEKGEYDKLIKQLTELYRYAPHYEKLEQALSQAQAMYRQAYTKEESSRQTGYAQELEELYKAQKFQELLETMQKNARKAAQDKNINELHEEYKRKIIEYKIAEKKELFASEKYEDIVNFLYQLQDIDKNSERVKKLLATYREKLLSTQIDDKREFILRASENAKNLFQLGKFEKAMIVAEEILHIDPKSPFAKQIWGSARSKYEKILQDETEDQIAKNYVTAQEERKVSPEKYTRL